MNREIKFRAWSNEHNRYCDLVTLDESGRWIGWIKSSGVYLTTLDIVLEQYTGLKDKNGEEIYEGDIVNITAIVETDDSDMACIMDTNSVVCWDKGHARWDVNDKPESKDWDYRRRRYFVFVGSDDRKNVEVIGNIHENKELLGAE